MIKKGCKIVFGLGIVLVLVALLINDYLGSFYRVDGDSMYPWLADNDLVYAIKVNDYSTLKTGDIVIIRLKDNKEVIKRVVALPNERIECINGFIYVNDKLLNETYLDVTTDDFEEIKLKENEYFVMGDNRQASFDSRIYGPIEDIQIKYLIIKKF